MAKVTMNEAFEVISSVKKLDQQLAEAILDLQSGGIAQFEPPSPVAQMFAQFLQQKMGGSLDLSGLHPARDVLGQFQPTIDSFTDKND